jgi:hypothetical protein
VSTDVAVYTPQQLTQEQVQFIANTEFVPKHYRGRLPEMFACILTGRALGLDDMTSLRQIYVVDGKATLSAELMVQLVRRAGHSITGSTSTSGAEAIGTRADNGDTMTVTFGPEDAKRAGLEQKNTYVKHPASMYWARAASQLCRMLFADVLAGVSYTPDEATLTPAERNAEITDALPLPPDEDSGPEPQPDVLPLDNSGSSFPGPHPEGSSGPEQLGGGKDSTGPVESSPEQTALVLPNDVRRRMENGE